ncbi:hypothetical protein AB4Z21_25985, partial [Paenibacillus sp. MCAF20]
MQTTQVHDWINRDIQSLRGYTVIEQVYKGYSGDMKFIVSKPDKRFFLKCFSLSELDQKQAEYDVLKQLETLGVK